jgi:hypothetical protein
MLKAEQWRSLLTTAKIIPSQNCYLLEFAFYFKMVKSSSSKCSGDYSKQSLHWTV